MKKLTASCVVAVLTIITSFVPVTLGQASGYRVLIDWRGPGNNAEATGLFFYWDDAGSQTGTLLLVTPTGQRFIGRTVLDAVAGRETYRLEDDQSGWWIEVHQQWPVNWPTRDALFQTGTEDLEAARERGEKMQVSVRTPSGVLLDTALPMVNPAEDFSALGRSLDPPQVQALREELPASVTESLPFLESVLANPSSQGSKLGPFVSFLRDQAGLDDATTSEMSWSESKEFKPGLNVEERRFASLLGSFQHINQEVILLR